MKSSAFAFIALILFLACNNSNTNNQSSDSSSTAIQKPPMDSTVTDAGSSLGNYKDTAALSMATYDTIAATFKGKPDAENVKKLLNIVLQQCKMDVTRDNVIQLATKLTVLRKNSKVGVTEMEILEHAYEHGTATDVATRINTSATTLEKTK